FACFDGSNVNGFAIESARDGNIRRCVAGSLALRLQFVDMVSHPETVFRTFSYASVDTFLVRGHAFCDLAVCAAMRIGDEALPCFLWRCALGIYHAGPRKQNDDPHG